jgi:succinylglutamic semialdehyde dehydrogenase
MHFIEGKFRKAHGISFSSDNPATRKSIWSGNSASQEDIDLAFTSSKNSQKEFSKLSFQQRVACLESFNTELDKQKNSLAKTISIETGKPYWESLLEVEAMENKLKITVDSYLDRCKTTAQLTHKPLGVTAVFGPFNLPAHLSHGHIIPSLLSGNSVIFKPSELTPLVGEQMMKIWEKSTLPKGVLNMLQGAALVGQQISKHSSLDALYFTGSYETGELLSKQFAVHPEKMLALEMGGNNPLVVWDASNLQAIVYIIIQSAFITSGQRCTCARRLILKKEERSSVIIDALTKAINKIKIGAYDQLPEPFMGPLIHKEAALKLLQAEETLEKKGGVILKKMRLLDPEGSFLTPGLIDVTHIKEKTDEEFFGPLLQIIQVDSFEDALHEANNTKFGLSAGLISDDEELFKQFHETIDAGIINFNAPLTGASSYSPFGGIKCSGNHRPSAYYAVNYCNYPCSSIVEKSLKLPINLSPGVFL